MLDRAAVVISFRAFSSICFFSALTLAGCSSSDSGGPAPTDGGSDAKADAGADTKVTFDSPGDTGPAVCWLVVASDPTEKKCDDCSNVKCNAERQECFGPSYLTGTFGGTCKDYITCQCGCTELDWSVPPMMAGGSA